MLLNACKYTKLQKCFDGAAPHFLTHMHVKLHVVVYLHHLAALFNNTNAVTKPEHGDQIVYGVFSQTFAKSYQFHCQIINNVL